MNQVSVEKVKDGSQGQPMLRETIELLDKVRARAFELFERRGGASGNDMRDWLQAEKEVFQVPNMELAENDQEFQLQLALPGFEAKDIRVAALPDAVIIEGESTHEHHSAKETIHCCEFGERRVFRQIPLPKPVDVDHITATLDKGVLKVRAAKALNSTGRRAA